MTYSRPNFDKDKTKFSHELCQILDEVTHGCPALRRLGKPCSDVVGSVHGILTDVGEVYLYVLKAFLDFNRIENLVGADAGTALNIAAPCTAVSRAENTRAVVCLISH